MYIAVVEDSLYDFISINNILKEVLANMSNNYTIMHFTTSESVLQEISINKFDILFIDIVLKGQINGMELARKLRKNNYTGAIVFTTSEPNLALDAFDLHALDYLVKPCSKERIIFALSRIKPVNDENLIHIKSGKSNFALPLNELMWVDTYNRNLYFHLTNQRTMSAAINFSDFLKLIENEECFIVPSRGIIVNLQFINSVESQDIVLMDKTLIPISRRRRALIKDSFSSYIFKKSRTVMPL